MEKSFWIWSKIIPLYFQLCIRDGVEEEMKAVRNFRQWEYVGQVAQLHVLENWAIM